MNKLFYNGPTVATLHTHYAKAGRLDEYAPIQSAREIYLAAPVEQVWQRLIDLSNWSLIDPAFRQVQLDTTVAVDATFSFVLNHFPIKARFAVVNPYQELCWSGQALWFKAVDRHRLAATTDGGTHYTLAESLSGTCATLLMNSAQLQKQHEQWLAAFKRSIALQTT